MITEDYVSFETAKLLKEKGFDEPCNNRYYETHFGFDLGLDPGYTNSHWEDWYKNMGVRNYSAPTLQMAMKWLRVHNIFISIECCTYPTLNKATWIPDITTFESVFPDSAVECNTYEEACEAAIKYCLENLV